MRKEEKSMRNGILEAQARKVRRRNLLLLCFGECVGVYAGKSKCSKVDVMHTCTHAGYHILYLEGYFQSESKGAFTAFSFVSVRHPDHPHLHVRRSRQGSTASAHSRPYWSVGLEDRVYQCLGKDTWLRAKSSHYLHSNGNARSHFLWVEYLDAMPAAWAAHEEADKTPKRHGAADHRLR